MLQDFTISIAAVHHLSTRPRRTSAIRTLLLPLFLSPHAPFSRFIVYVWAYEQGESSKRKMGVLAPGRPSGIPGVEPGVEEEEGGVGGGKGDQDVLVPWVLQEDQKKKEKKRKRKVGPRTATSKQNGPSGEDDQVKREEAEDENDKGKVEKDQPDVEVVEDEPTPDPPRQVYHRYYHLYTEGELREDVIRAAEGMGFDVIALPRGSNESTDENKDTVDAGMQQGKKRTGGKWLKVTGEGYEKDNWYLEGEVGLYE